MDSPRLKWNGLNDLEVLHQRKKFGFNELPLSKPKRIWKIALEVVQEPMFILLLVCGLLYILLGDAQEGFVLISSIILIIVITFYQYQKTERALDELKKLSSPRATVIRNGLETKIPGRELVPGDIVMVHEGDRIPADGHVLMSGNLNIDESILTGESLPVLKTNTSDRSSSSEVYNGTLVVQGSGCIEIKDTGLSTRYGKIGLSLHNISATETRLQKELKIFIRNIFIGSIIICLLVIIAFYWSSNNFLQSLLNGLAASMAILPEEFPVVLTIFLALGAWRLSKNKVLTRKPSAIETLGSATIICSDKTGTITKNTMEVAAMFDGEKIWNKSEIEHSTHLHSIIDIARQASKEWSNDPMEKALNKLSQELKIVNNNEVIKEYPFSSSLPIMTVIRQSTDGIKVICCKGAPELIESLCRHSTEQSVLIQQAIQELSVQSYRVIGVAEASCKSEFYPDDQKDFNFTFKGLLAFEDPIREEVTAAIKECREAGIKVMMMTGDYLGTALSIGKQIGLGDYNNQLIGNELDQQSEEQLLNSIQKVNIIARVTPEQKLKIVQLLQKKDEVVAMTGDGVNDAPALKAADIGISMGKKGTDVAREASSLVLMDDNFASIVLAIRSGRRIFDNLQKAMSYILSIHIPIIGLAIIPALVKSIPLLLMPIHIVFLELIIDPVCSIAFEYEQEEKDIMKRPPRDPSEKFFSRKRMFYSLLKGILLLIMVLSVYYISIEEGHTIKEARAITFIALIIGNMALIISSLSASRSFLEFFNGKNYMAIVILIIALVVLLATIYIPQIQQIFSFEHPGLKHFWISMVGALFLLIILEGLKQWQKIK